MGATKEDVERLNKAIQEKVRQNISVPEKKQTPQQPLIDKNKLQEIIIGETPKPKELSTPGSKPIEKPKVNVEVTTKKETIQTNTQSETSPLFDMLRQNQEKLQAAYDDIKKINEAYTKKIEDAYNKLEQAMTGKLPEPPDIEKIKIPQDDISKVMKFVVPVLVGITTIINPGRYGENLVYFNSMIEGIKKNDLASFAEALRQWEIDYKYALTDKQMTIKALETELQKLHSLRDAGVKGAEYEAKKIESQIKSLVDMINQVEKQKDMALKTLKTIMDIKIKEQKLRSIAKSSSKPPKEWELYERYKRLPEEEKEKFKEFLGILKPSDFSRFLEALKNQEMVK